MANTYLSLHYHIVFGTKSRRPFITSDWRSPLHEYLGVTLRGLGGIPECIGGVEDHVHILAGLKSTHMLADVVRELKKASCSWAREKMNVTAFEWQEGYSAFTVSSTACDGVKIYIQNQEAHHHKKSHGEELEELFKLAGVKYDIKYIL